MNSAGLLELGLVFGSVLGLLVWELFAVRRSQRRDAARERGVDPDDRPAS